MCMCRVAHPVPRRSSKASCCCRSASRTRTWPSAGRENPLSSGDSTTVAPADAAASTDVEEAEPRDERRELLLSRFQGELGDAIVDSHIRVGSTLWLRVTRDAWKQTAEVAKESLGFRWFDF